MTRPLQSPLQDDRFLLLETLGRGAMGSVYRAYDRAEQQLVALKVPTDDEPAGPGHSLSSEFDTWVRLRHRNIVQAYELRLARTGPIRPGTPYLVLEHVEGGPIHRILTAGALDDGALTRIAGQLLQALDRVHCAGFVHRDLKPANVLADSGSPSGSDVRLTDFGLAAPTGTSREIGVISGSLPFAAPESWIGGPVDGRSDLYGMGILLYFLATGSMPFTADDPRALCRWHLTGAPVDPARVRPELSPRLVRFVRRLTRRDPAARPRTAMEALELLGSRSNRAPRAPEPRISRATRAGLRLSLDAARLGAARLFLLPPVRGDAEALIDEASVWSQVRGIELYRLRSTTLAVARLVLQLATERGAAGADELRRSGIGQLLPLGWIGDLPILDRSPPGSTALRRAQAAIRRGARSVCGFIWRSAVERSMVVTIEPASDSDPLGRAVARRLVEAVRGAGGPGLTPGGLLVLASRSADDAG